MKKIISVLLMFTIMLSVTACAGTDKKTTAQSVINKIIETKATSGEINISLDAGSEGSCDVKINISGDSDKNALIDVYAKINYDTYSMDDYEKVTDIYVFNSQQQVYLNITQIKKFLVNVDDQFAMFTAIFSFPGEYLIVDKESLEELLSQYDVDIAEETQEISEVTDEDKKDLAQYLGEIIDELAENTTDAVTITENNLSFHLTQENADSICDALLEMDFEKFLSDDARSQITEGEINEECYEKIRAVKENIEDLSGIDSDLVIGSDGKSITSSFTVTTNESENTSENSDEYAALTVTYESGNNTTQIDAPESTMSLEEFVNVISKLLSYMK